jgi:hypothetical protein
MQFVPIDWHHVSVVIHAQYDGNTTEDDRTDSACSYRFPVRPCQLSAIPTIQSEADDETRNRSSKMSGINPLRDMSLIVKRTSSKASPCTMLLPMMQRLLGAKPSPIKFCSKLSISTIYWRV